MSPIFYPKEEDEDVDAAEQSELLVKKVGSATIKYTASLVFASIGAGVGAALIRPSLGQWIGEFSLSIITELSFFFASSFNLVDKLSAISEDCHSLL